VAVTAAEELLDAVGTAVVETDEVAVLEPEAEGLRAADGVLDTVALPEPVPVGDCEPVAEPVALGVAERLELIVAEPLALRVPE
jgi:hypothetical protein